MGAADASKTVIAQGCFAILFLTVHCLVVPQAATCKRHQVRENTPQEHCLSLSISYIVTRRPRRQD